MPDLSKLLEQWAVIQSAPIPFVIAVVIAAGIVWGIVAFSYSTVLGNKNATIELLSGRVSAYQDKLKGATPEQAATEIQTLREQLAETRKRLEGITNPPREDGAIYQKGKKIGVVGPFKIDAANKRVAFTQITIGGDLDQATHIEFRNLVLAFDGADGTTSSRQGLVGTTTYVNPRFAIVGQRTD